MLSGPRRGGSAALQALSETIRRTGQGEPFNTAYLRQQTPETALGYRLAGETEVELGLVEVGIPAAAQAVLGDILGFSYAIDPTVEGRITLQTTRPMQKEDLLDTFEQLLAYNGAVLMVEGEHAMIVPRGEAPLRFGNARPSAGAGRQINIVPLRYIAADQLISLIRPFIAEGAVVNVDSRRHILLATGTPSELQTILDAVNLFDVDRMFNRSVALVPLRTADPEEMATELGHIFNIGDASESNHLIEFVPNQRLNAMLVIATHEEHLEEAESWIRRLDREAGSADRQLFVYEVQNRSAEDLAPLLQRLLSDGTSGNNGAAIAASSPSRPSLGEARDFGTAAAGGEQITAAGGLAFDADGFGKSGVRVVADNGSNAVLVYASSNQYEHIDRMLSRLDTMPNQVLLEATIAEVSLTDELRFGVRWFFESGHFAVRSTNSATGAIDSVFQGFSLLFSGGDGRLALSALASLTDVNVISSPSLMVLDNHEARLQIGDEVPVVTQSAASVADPNAVIVNTISVRDTGIILRVIPRVNESGRVTLEIQQEVSDVVPTTSSGIDSPTIRQRQVTTSVVVNDGETLALGGLIQERNNATRSQVPILGDLPILGSLFRSVDDTQGRTELLILITPRVVRNLQEARDVTDEFRRRLRKPQTPSRDSRSPTHTLRRIIR